MIFRAPVTNVRLSLLLVALIAVPAVGQDESDLREQIRRLIENQQRMQERQDRLEQENTALRSRLESMTDSHDNGLTEARAREMRAVAENVLAEAEKARADITPSFGVNPGGAGAFIKTDDFYFRVLGYVQAQATISDSSLDRTDGNGDFSIRRARIDFLLDFYEDFQLLVEFDGGPGNVPGASDFALVEARMNWKVIDNDLQFRFGKFTTQFSTENARTSRDIDTIERFNALNAMFLLPALDVQFGVMAHGLLGADDRLYWSAGVYNGNGRANDNLSDNNNSKEIQAKLGWRFSSALSANIAFDYSDEERQTLSFVDQGFNRYVSVPIEGKRIGFGGDIFWERGRWSVRAEGLAFQFDGVNESDVGLFGGFIQPAVFITGDAQRGVQLLARGDIAHLDADSAGDGDTIFSLLGGVNWFINPNTRLQVNAIAVHFDGPSSLLGFDDSRTLPLLQTQLQFKF